MWEVSRDGGLYDVKATTPTIGMEVALVAPRPDGADVEAGDAILYALARGEFDLHSIPGGAGLISTASKECGLEDYYDGHVIYLSNPTNDPVDSACVASKVCVGAGLETCPSLDLTDPGPAEKEYLPGVWVGWRNVGDQWSVIIWGSAGADVFAGG